MHGSQCVGSDRVITAAEYNAITMASTLSPPAAPSNPLLTQPMASVPVPSPSLSVSPPALTSAPTAKSIQRLDPTLDILSTGSGYYINRSGGLVTN